LFALEHHRQRLPEDISRARRFAEALRDLPDISLDLAAVQSNIVRFEVTSMSAGAFVDACHARGVHLLPGGHHGVRAVMHLGISDEDATRAVEAIREVLGAL
jgi:threonine aldolase